MRLFIIYCFLFFWLKANGQETVDSSTWELVIPVEISESRSTVSNIVNLSRKDFLSLPASFDDPSRLLLKFPGFSNANDQNNSIIYHGMPAWMSGWTLYGAEILNPNHLSAAGTANDRTSRSSGGVNAFSGQVIGKYTYRGNPDIHTTSDYYAGVSDIKLRDPYKNQVSLNTSLIGMEAGLDLKGKHWNLMSNARYSTVGLLADLGVDFGGEEITYEDVMAKVGFKKGMVNFDVYSLYGTSRNFKDFNLDNPKEDDDLLLRDQDEKLFIVGTHMEIINERSSFETTVNYSSENKSNLIQRSNGSGSPRIDDDFLISANSSLHLHRDKMDWEINYRLKHFGDSNNSESLYQAAIFNKYIVSSRFFINTGLSWNFHWFRERWEHKPNFSLGINWIDRSYNYKTSLKFSSNNQVGNLIISDNRPKLFNAKVSLENVKRKMNFDIFFHHFPKIERYSDFGFFLGFFNDSSWFYIFPPTTFLQIKSNIFGFSFSKSQKVSERLLSNLHWTMTYARQNVLEESFKLPMAPLFNFGFNLNYIDLLKEGLDLSLSTTIHSGFNTGHKSFQVEPYSVRTPFYIRSDLRLNYSPQKKDKKYQSMISLDIQNLTNRKNIIAYYFDDVAEEILPRKQLGILPVLSWRIVI